MYLLIETDVPILSVCETLFNLFTLLLIEFFRKLFSGFEFIVFRGSRVLHHNSMALEGEECFWISTLLFITIWCADDEHWIFPSSFPQRSEKQIVMKVLIWWSLLLLIFIMVSCYLRIYFWSSMFIEGWT